MSRQIFAVEINHENAPVYVKEKFNGESTTVKHYLKSFSTCVEEVFILATTNRFALYAVHEDITPIINFFVRQPQVMAHAQFYYCTEESIINLFATASGLLSPVKGDHHIIAQIRNAYQLALECDTIGLLLDNVIRGAIHIGKMVRTQTGIDKYCMSVVDTGLSLLYQRITDVYTKNFLVIGTGRIARLALEYLRKEGITKIVIASQDGAEGKMLAEELGLEAIDMGHLLHHFIKADVIIAGTNHEIQDGTSTLIQLGIGYLSKYNSCKSRIILDFGVPRNFDSKLREYPRIELYNLDDLKMLNRTPLDAFGGLEEAWKIVMNKGKEFLKVVHQLEVSPILSAYWTRLVNIKNEEFDRLLPDVENATEQEILLMRKYAHKIIRKITNDPIRNIQTITNNLKAENAHQLVKDFCKYDQFIFNLSQN